MAWYSSALRRALPENNTQPHIRPTQVILHISAGESLSLYPLWQTEGLESHFYSPRVNQLEQYMDTVVMADANLTANRRPDGTGAISVETQGADAATGQWNPKQQEDIVNLLVWAHKTHGIPLRLCTSPSDPGIGWHVMWGAPGAWTPVSKTCPGPTRIKQIPGLIARANAIVNGTQEDISIVDAATKTYLDNQFAALHGARNADLTDVLGKVETTYNQVNLRTGALATAQALAALPAQVASAVAAVTLDSLPAGSTVDTAALSAAVAKAAADEVAKRLAA